MTETAESYFSVIEEHFRVARGIMFSPLDWALMDAWKNGGIPIEAVLRGIDTASARWRKQPAGARARGINCLSYCTSAIAEEAQAMANRTPSTRKERRAAVQPPGCTCVRGQECWFFARSGILRSGGIA